MDRKLMVAGIAVVLLVFGGLAIAVPAMENSADMSGGYPGPGKPPQPQGNCSGGNFTAPDMNFTMPDKAQVEKFGNAVRDGDYNTAKALDDEYHIGGPMFSKLNETTFATYSEIAKLQAQLMSELGMNQTVTDGFSKQMHGPQQFGGPDQTDNGTSGDYHPVDGGPGMGCPPMMPPGNETG